jgi:transposase-like protein
MQSKNEISAKPGLPPISLSEMTDIVEEFDCPVCFDQMVSPKKIYSCSNDHYICSICLADPKIFQCPQCREDFVINNPTRRISTERIAAKMFIISQNT